MKSNQKVDVLLTNFELTPAQIDEANNYKDVITVRNSITQEGRNIYNITPGETTTLQQIAATSNLQAGGIARAILRQNGEFTEPFVYIPNTNETKRTRARTREEDENFDNEFLDQQPLVFPNPSNGNFNVKLIILKNGTTLKIVGVDGKEVYTQSLTEGEQNIKINTEGWAKGAYILRVEHEDSLIIEQKLSLL
jgi:hypothetical protein